MLAPTSNNRLEKKTHDIHTVHSLNSRGCQTHTPNFRKGFLDIVFDTIKFVISTSTRQIVFSQKWLKCSLFKHVAVTIIPLENKLEGWSECTKSQQRTPAQPLHICTTPKMMMMPRAKSLPAVKTFCTQVAHCTLKQFTHVNNTGGQTEKINPKQTNNFLVK